MAAALVLTGTFSLSARAGERPEAGAYPPEPPAGRAFETTARPAESGQYGLLPARRPYRAIGDSPAEFNGPDRIGDDPHVLEVRIGLFCPSDGDGISIQRGAHLAVAQANSRGGYHGKPFAIAFRKDDGLWGGGSGQMVRLVYGDSVWAVLGSSTGPATHVAEQIANRARVVLMTPTATDPSLTRTNVPWIFRCAPDDQSQADALARYLFLKKGWSHVAAISPATHDGACGVSELEHASSRWGHPLALSVKYRPGEAEFTSQLSLLEGAVVEAVVVWAPPLDAARIIKRMRARGMNQPVIGNCAIAVPAFVEAAGAEAEGVVAPSWSGSRAGTDTGDAFRHAFMQRHGQAPDMHAAYAYDGMRLIVEAIGAAGLNRARIRDAVAARDCFLGATGRIEFDGTGANTTPMPLARIVDGQFRSL